jgi:hypothetical protein
MSVIAPMVIARVAPESAARLQRVFARLTAETGRTAQESLEYMALKCAESGRSITKPRAGSRYHAVQENPEWKQAQVAFRWARARARRGETVPLESAQAITKLERLKHWRFIVPHQEKPTTYRYSNDKMDPRKRRVGRRGLATRTFGRLVGALGSLRGNPGSDATPEADSLAGQKFALRRSSTPKSHRVQMEALLTYLGKAYPGIRGQMMTRAAAGMEGYLDRQMQKSIARARARAA